MDAPELSGASFLSSPELSFYSINKSENEPIYKVIAKRRGVMKMKITPNAANFQAPKLPKEEQSKKDETAKNEQASKQPKDEYIPSKPNNSGVYKKPTQQVDTNLIAKLKAESEKAHEQLRNLVKQMLERQGMSFNDVMSGEKEFVVDEQARTEAQAAIGEGGPSSPENVSDRIVDFAKAISGGDKSKFNLLKGAIQDGFNAARDVLGGTLPEISEKTYDLVMQKLDQWMDEE